MAQLDVMAALTTGQYVMCIQNITLVASLIFLTACSIPPNKPIISNANGVKIYSSTADRQSTFIKDHGSLERICAARVADVADTKSEAAGLSLGVIGKSEAVSDGASQGAISLGGRSPSVLITRELMYRTCETIMNLNLSKTEALQLYLQTLKATVSISQSQTNSGTTSIRSTLPAITINNKAIEKGIKNTGSSNTESTTDDSGSEEENSTTDDDSDTAISGDSGDSGDSDDH